jgi:ABC-type antimicrobial peptide transport system permease subunit
MRGNVLAVAWYWVRATIRMRWTSYLIIVVLVGSIGGLALGSLSAARRTQSSFNVFLASTNPSDLTVTLYAPNIASELARLPLVRHVGVATYSVNAFPAGRKGAPDFTPALVQGSVTGTGSVTDEYFTEDKVAVLAGRMAEPGKADEFVADTEAEHLMGWHLGESVRMYFYTDAQASLSDFGTNKVKPRVSLTMHLVGTIVRNTEVLLDQADRKPDLMIFTPALTHEIVNNKLHYNLYSLQLDHGVRDLSAVQREIISILPRGTTYSFNVTSVIAGEVNRSIEPESIALGVFGLIALLVALVIAAGLLARTLRGESDDLDVMRALGASPVMTSFASLLGLLASILMGGFLAVGVAVALSPLSPIGPVRAVYPDRGFAFDTPVLIYGFLFLVVALVAMTLLFTRRRVRQQYDRRRLALPSSRSRVGRLAADLGLPVTAVVGVRFAFEPGRDRDAVPVRSALVGSILAVAIVVATLTFGNSLATLVSHPSLYGWNWNYVMAGNGSGVPPQAVRLLKSDPYVATWSGDNFANAQINGVTVPIILTTYRASVTAPILSGHAVDGPGQIVLGAQTMLQLHKRLGQTVTASYGTKKDYPVYVPPTKMTIVGTATLPAIGGTLTSHTSMGVGAILPIDIEPPAFKKFLHAPFESLNGYSAIFVRLKKGAPAALALASLEKIAHYGTKLLYAVPNGGGSAVAVRGVQYPAEIENYRTIGVVPDLLALALAAGAVVALALTLVASVHRRRRDLALLRTLGFTRRQLMSAVAWQASVAGAVGIVAGIPIGVLCGRWLWTLFARNIFAVPEPTVPVVPVIIVAIAAMALANIVAALPGRSAAQTSTAQVLRGE